MFRFLRSLHKVAGLAGSLFLILIALTGFVLALKSVLPGVRPPTRGGSHEGAFGQFLHPDQAVQAAIGAGLPGLQSLEDVDRLEIHAGKGIYKVLSKEGYHEVQVDGGSGKVLSISRRNDQLMEDIHDLSILHPVLRITLLPVVAAVLLLLGISGVVMYFTPVLRRARHKRQEQAKNRRSALQ